MDFNISYEEKQILQQDAANYNIDSTINIIVKEGIKMFDAAAPYGRAKVVMNKDKFDLLLASCEGEGTFYPAMDEKRLWLHLRSHKGNMRIFQTVKGYLKAKKSLETYKK